MTANDLNAKDLSEIELTASEQALDPQQIALGIRQPWAELILAGIKTIEVRSRPTNVRGPIYLYTSKTLANDPLANQAIEQFQLKPQQLTLGQIVGQVEIRHCRLTVPEDTKRSCLSSEALAHHYAWELTNPVRFARPVTPRFLPYGVWFYPFVRRKQSPSVRD